MVLISYVVGLLVGILITVLYFSARTTTGEFLVDTSDENVDRYTFRFDDVSDLKKSKYVKCKVIHWGKSA